MAKAIPKMSYIANHLLVLFIQENTQQLKDTIQRYHEEHGIDHVGNFSELVLKEITSLKPIL